jgi:hypothetical protein
MLFSTHYSHLLAINGVYSRRLWVVENFFKKKKNLRCYIQLKHRDFGSYIEPHLPQMT